MEESWVSRSLINPRVPRSSALLTPRINFEVSIIVIPEVRNVRYPLVRCSLSLVPLSVPCFRLCGFLLALLLRIGRLLNVSGLCRFARSTLTRSRNAVLLCLLRSNLKLFNKMLGSVEAKVVPVKTRQVLSCLSSSYKSFPFSSSDAVAWCRGYHISLTH